MFKKVSEIRSTTDGLWSDGPLLPGQVILSPTIPKRITAYCGDVLLALFSSVTTASSLGPILRNGRSLHRKLELIMAEYTWNQLLVVGSPLYWYLLGFRLANCECSPGLGHRHLKLPIRRELCQTKASKSLREQ